jgi:hypothetical protein
MNAIAEPELRFRQLIPKPAGNDVSVRALRRVGAAWLVIAIVGQLAFAVYVIGF